MEEDVLAIKEVEILRQKIKEQRELVENIARKNKAYCLKYKGPLEVCDIYNRRCYCEESGEICRFFDESI